MLQQINKKKILLYFSLFILFGTFNNKNFEITKINQIEITGLDSRNNLELVKNLEFLKTRNLFFLDKKEVEEVISLIDLIEKY